jgi:hypothetical protein
MTLYRYPRVTDPRLGRHVNHDARNARQEYAIAPLPKRAIKSVDWTRRVPIFNQGQVGSCTFNAAAGCYATDSPGRTGSNLAHVAHADAYGVFAPADYVVQEDPFVVEGYSLTTKIDPFPGDYPSQDTGSDGPSAAAALVLLGLAVKYNHAFSLDAAKAAIQLGPIMWGTVWLNSMYDLNAHNELVVDVNSGTAGGHEMEISAYDVTTDMWKIPQSWGEDEGDHGWIYVSSPNLDTLLHMDGDITQPVFATAPVPPKPITGQALYNKIKVAAKAGGLT